MPRKLGFSLVEVLIVVGIIAVLAAILFSLSQSAIESGKMSKSAQNLRQLYVAHVLYTNDSDGNLCPYPTTTQNSVLYWAGVQGVNFGTSLIKKNRESVDRYIKNEDVWFCPGDPCARQLSPCSRHFNLDHSVTSYAYMAGLSGNAFNAWRDSNPRPLFIVIGIDSPDLVFALAEPFEESANLEPARAIWSRPILQRIGKDGNLIKATIEDGSTAFF
jgi:prepilin-type N-terminal cleavage/methylation domain-containing protein